MCQMVQEKYSASKLPVVFFYCTSLRELKYHLIMVDCELRLSTWLYLQDTALNNRKNLNHVWSGTLRYTLSRSYSLQIRNLDIIILVSPTPIWPRWGKVCYLLFLILSWVLVTCLGPHWPQCPGPLPTKPCPDFPVAANDCSIFKKISMPLLPKPLHRNPCLHQLPHHRAHLFFLLITLLPKCILWYIVSVWIKNCLYGAYSWLHITIKQSVQLQIITFIAELLAAFLGDISPS